MDKHLKECLVRFDSKVMAAVDDGRINGRPFVVFTNNAADIFSGFQAIIELIQVNQLMEESNNEQEAAQALSDYDANSLLTMMRSVSDVMANQAGSLSDWASERLREVSDEK